MTIALPEAWPDTARRDHAALTKLEEIAESLEFDDCMRLAVDGLARALRARWHQAVTEKPDAVG